MRNLMLLSMVVCFVTGCPCPEESDPLTVNIGSLYDSRITGRVCDTEIMDEYWNYEVIAYAGTNQWWIQPYANNYRHGLGFTGFFSIDSNPGDEWLVLVVKKGQEWSPTVTLGWNPIVDGENIVAKWTTRQHVAYTTTSVEPGGAMQ